MANQRMSVRCRACGAEQMIAKRMIGAFYTYPGLMESDDWNDWFEKHEFGFCSPEGEWDLDIFELSYEFHVKGHPSQSDGGA